MTIPVAVKGWCVYSTMAILSVTKIHSTLNRQLLCLLVCTRTQIGGAVEIVIAAIQQLFAAHKRYAFSIKLAQ